MARGRWASLARLLVCRRTGLVVFKIAPWSGRIGSSARDGPSAPRRAADERAKLSCLLHLGISATVRRAMAAEPRGAREAVCRRRLPRGSENARDRTAADTVRIDAGKTGIGLTACAGSEVALGERDCGQSSFSQLKLSEKQAKAIFISERRCTLHAASSSTLSNSTKGWLAWQRRS